jgi:hypothetical protein
VRVIRPTILGSADPPALPARFDARRTARWRLQVVLAADRAGVGSLRTGQALLETRKVGRPLPHRRSGQVGAVDGRFREVEGFLRQVRRDPSVGRHAAEERRP